MDHKVSLFARLRRCLLTLLVCCLISGSVAAQTRVRRDIPTAPALPPEEQAKQFHLPPGFRIELVAAEPDVAKPINLNFDARGRLFVTTSVEYPFAPPPGQAPLDSIKMLVDSDGDGVTEKVTTFADGLSIPVGVTPMPGGVLGHSIPNLYHFYDSNDDGRADGREVAYGQFGYGDTHGMVSSLTWWIDGWIYACHSNNNKSIAKGSDGHEIDIKTGHTHRFRPDGSHIEFFTHGQVNPFGLAFDPLGNAFNADCHTKPVYLLLRGAYYPDFFKPHDGLGFAPTMLRHTHGSTGIAGIVYYAADQFPEEYRDTIFLGNPMTGRINRDRLEAHGSSYAAIEQPDFLSCDDPWFRPVDLQLAPDGSIYVADFYAPIISHYEVPLTHPRRDRQRGRIWRIRYVGTADTPRRVTRTADLTRASVDQLIAFLKDSNLLIRTHATHQLVHRLGQPAQKSVKQMMLAESSTASQRAHGLWVLERLGRLDDQTLDRLATDDERLVRVHLMKALAERGSWKDIQRDFVIRALGDQDAFVRRAAADALGQHPHARNVAPLLELWSRTSQNDTHLIHVTRIALRDTARQLNNLSELAQHYGSSPEQLRRLADICLGIRSPQSAAFLLDHFQYQGSRSSLDHLYEVLHHIGRYIDVGSISRLHQLLFTLNTEPARVRLVAMRAIQHAAQERGINLPQEIVELGAELALNALNGSDPASMRGAIELAQELKLKEAVPMLRRLATASTPRRRPRSPGGPRGSLRPLAFDALVAIDETVAITVFTQLLKVPATPSGLRWRLEKAMTRLARPDSYSALLDELHLVSEVVETTIIRGLSGSVGGARALLEQVEKGTLSPRILRDPRVNVNLQYAGVTELDERLAKLTQGLPSEDERLYDLIAQRRAGYLNVSPDVARGLEVYTKNCGICHQIGGKGQKLGPELDGIGMRGLDRLLEDVLDPNRNVDATFRATVFVLSDGRLVTGRVLREERQVVMVADYEGKEQRIAMSDIDDRQQTKLSSMPTNVHELVKEDEFYDLIGFLLTQRETQEADRN